MAKYKLEYIWLDGYTPLASLRSKTQIKDFASFPDLRKLKDKQVVVTGKCIDYKGQPELEISLLKQLQVIE